MCRKHILAIDTLLGQRGARLTWIKDGSCSAAAIHCLTALGLSATGKSHHVSHAGVSGFARNVGTYGAPGL